MDYKNYVIITLLIYILPTLISLYYTYNFLLKKNNYIIYKRNPYIVIFYVFFFNIFVMLQIINNFKIIECRIFEILTSISVIFVLSIFLIRGFILYINHFSSNIKLDMYKNKNNKYKWYYRYLISKKLIISILLFSIFYLSMNIIIILFTTKKDEYQDCYNGPSLYILAIFIIIFIIFTILLIYLLKNKHDNLKIKTDLSITLFLISFSFFSWLLELIPKVHYIEYKIFPYSEIIYILSYCLFLFSSIIYPLKLYMNNKHYNKSNYIQEIKHYIYDDNLYNLLLNFSKNEFVEENILFLNSIKLFKENPTKKKYDEIINMFIDKNSLLIINIDNKQRNKIYNNINIDNQNFINIFDELEIYVMDLIYKNFWKRFINKINNLK